MLVKNKIDLIFILKAKYTKQQVSVKQNVYISLHSCYF